jgi:adenylate cyclase
LGWHHPKVGETPAVTAIVAEPGKSVAVLPFAELSQDQNQEWFADGLTEEILNALARTPDLMVTSRTSAFLYKSTEKSISTIAEELGVAHVLEGSVRGSRDRIRVTAQLIRATDDFHLWSQTYDRDVEGVIGIQEDIALRIARALEIEWRWK